MKKRVIRQIFTGLASGLIAGVIVWLLTSVGTFKDFFYRFEAVTYDWRMRKIIEPPKFQLEDVIIIDIDGRTLNKLGSFYQWSRTEWAKLLRILKEGNVSIVGLDVLFDPSKRFPREDASFIRAVKEHGGVVSSVVFTPADEDNFLYPMTSEPEGLDVDRFRVDLPDELRYHLYSFDRMEPDFPALANASAAIGAVNLSSDHDGVLRRIPLFIRFNEHVYPTLAMSMAMQHLHATGVRYYPDTKEVEILTGNGDGIRIPVDDKGRTLIYYSGPFQTFRYISFYSLIYELYKHKDESKILEYFKDKVVIVGASAPGLYDLRSTPRQPSFPGVEVHANVFHQIINHQFIHPFTGGQSFSLMLIIGLIAGLFFTFSRSGRGILFTVILTIAIFTYAWYMFSARLVWVPMIAPTLTVLLTFTIHYAYRYQVEERDKRQIKKLFSHYVTPSIVDEMLKHPDKVKLGGEKKECTVLFSDIADFTALSEKTAPEKLVKFLNEYLNAMTKVILNNQGTLDKYEGDAIMAIFGAPLDIHDHALKACQTALYMQQRLHALREEWQRRKMPNLFQRIGINTGEMVVGNMGSEIRFDYTAIGDAVNLGARLETANKFYGTNILISENTYQKVRDQVIVRQLDMLRVKGRQEPVKVYELVAMKNDSLDERIKELLNVFQQGYQYYLAQNWDWAMKQFQQALQINGDDGPSRTYLQRCQQFIKSPPPPNWDGVFTFQNK